MGREVDHKFQPNAVVKEKVELCRLPPLGPHDLLQGKHYLNVYYSVSLHLVLKFFLISSKKIR